MHLGRVEVHEFRGLSGVEFDLAPTATPGLVVLEGPNEAGKSTLLAFVRALVFPESRGQGEHLKGSITLHDGENRYRLERNGGRSTTKLVDARTGAQLDGARLAAIVGNLDGNVYRNVFAFGLTELQAFDALTDDAVRERLYSAAVAGAGRSASAATTKLEAVTDKLLKPRAQSVLGDLARDLAEARRGAAQAASEARRYEQLTAELAAIAAEAEALRSDQREAADSAAWHEKLLQLWPDWSGRAGALDDLGQLELEEGALNAPGAGARPQRLAAQRGRDPVLARGPGRLPPRQSGRHGAGSRTARPRRDEPERTAQFGAPMGTTAPGGLHGGRSLEGARRGCQGRRRRGHDRAQPVRRRAGYGEARAERRRARPSVRVRARGDVGDQGGPAHPRSERRPPQSVGDPPSKGARAPARRGDAARPLRRAERRALAPRGPAREAAGGGRTRSGRARRPLVGVDAGRPRRRGHGVRRMADAQDRRRRRGGHRRRARVPALAPARQDGGRLRSGGAARERRRGEPRPRALRGRPRRGTRPPRARRGRRRAGSPRRRQGSGGPAHLPGGGRGRPGSAGRRRRRARPPAQGRYPGRRGSRPWPRPGAPARPSGTPGAGPSARPAGLRPRPCRSCSRESPTCRSGWRGSRP